jgi:hypothetical protein
MVRQNGGVALGIQMVRGLAVLLYVSGGVALLFACLGYVFSFVHYGARAGFVLELSGHALWLALGLLVLAMVLDMIFQADGGRGRR